MEIDIDINPENENENEKVNNSRAEQSRVTPMQTEYLRYHVQAFLVVVVVDGIA